MNFAEQPERQQVDDYLKQWLGEFSRATAGEAVLLESMEYSLMSGGKRFRPVLSLWVAQALNQNVDDAVLSFACAVEMIHTYSLIHDDLPCMDDDQERRGRPTNHVKFGEDIALLAGDSLLTEAFQLVLSKGGAHAAKAALELANGSGMRGMVGGQAIDLYGQKNELMPNEMERLHRMKTGALIATAVRGVARVAGVDEETFTHLSMYAESLGYAFQVADDILDYDPKQNDLENIVCSIGLDAAKEKLEELSQDAHSALSVLSIQSEKLEAIIEFNRTRSH